MRIGVDIGGTFTDLILLDQDDGRTWTAKVPSTPDDPARAVLAGLDLLLTKSGALSTQIQFLGHGTTIATNAFLQRRGAKTGLITTEGFRDVLEFRRLARDGPIDAYDLFFDFPKPLAERAARVEVRERVDFAGTTLEPLDLKSVDSAIDILRDLEVDAVAISLLHSYIAPEHEQIILGRLRERLPDVYVSASHRVNPEMLEYERTSTTVINAYLGPPVASYIEKLNRAVVARDLPGVHLLQSNGGLVGASAAADLPVALLESGPAGGLAACVKIGEAVGEPNLVMLDVGGTSTDIAVIHASTPRLMVQTQIDGYAIRCPMADIRSIGAGGGSLIQVTAEGGLRVGPQSAGAVPGPVCYDQGGTIPAMTDAIAALGILGPATLLGGEMTISHDTAVKSLESPARALDMDVMELAAGAFRIMNANIAASVRVALVERGLDPRDFAIIALGGAGPVHAGSVARELGIPRVVIPPHPGITSALGAATTDLVHHYQSAVMATIDAIIPEELDELLASMEVSGRQVLESEGIPSSAIEMRRLCDMRYLGQYHEAPIELSAVVDTRSLSQAASAFHVQHKSMYGFNQPNDPVMITNVRVQARGPVHASIFMGDEDHVTSIHPHPPADHRLVAVEDLRGVNWPVLNRSQIQAGTTLSGPCIIEQPDTTTVILTGEHVTCHPTGCIVIGQRGHS
jgi:N-methylhydantoinase A